MSSSFTSGPCLPAPGYFSSSLLLAKVGGAACDSLSAGAGLTLNGAYSQGEMGDVSRFRMAILYSRLEMSASACCDIYCYTKEHAVSSS